MNNDRFKFRLWAASNDYFTFPHKMIYGNVVEWIDDELCISRDCGAAQRGAALNDTAILMQCTGLKDKNGKLIFEGDIIQSSGEIFEVKWADYTGNWGLYQDEEYQLDMSSRCGDAVRDTHRGIILGNIYENPELLDKDLQILRG